VRRGVFLRGHAEILHPSALPRLRHMSAHRPFPFGVHLSFFRLFTNCQHGEMPADACLQSSIQSRFDPDRGPARPRPHHRLRYQHPAQRLPAQLDGQILQQIPGRQCRAEIAVLPLPRLHRFGCRLFRYAPVGTLASQPVYHCGIRPFLNLLRRLRNPRSLILSCSVPCFCFRCPRSTSCRTFNRSRSFSLNVIRSCLFANSHWLK
jgi:hypothetical protein